MSREQPTGREGFVDAVVSGVLNADEQELLDEAASAGEDLAEAAASLRGRFLERVAAARARELPVGDGATLVDGSQAGAATRDDASECPRTIGRYPILRRLGAGGMGVVYAAYDELLDRRLAIKVLHDHVWDSDGRRRERLLREAQAMARVVHPNVITVHEVGVAGEQLFVVMEFVAGPTLKDWLASEERSWREIVAVFRQVADGLAAIHAAGLVHRDVKPTNVLIGDDGRVRVLDLGLVVASEELVETGEQALTSSSSLNRIGGSLTMTGERVGTPAYMSREQFLGLELTPASDVFSLCVALYEALHGVHPFMASTFYELQANVVAGRIAPPKGARAVPAWLHALVVRGLAADPRDRPASMQALSGELGRDPGRVRLRWIGGLAIAAIAAGVGVLFAGSSPVEAPPSCDGGAATIAAVWSPARAEQVRGALLATERPYASALADRVERALDDYADEWAAAHSRTCREHARGDHSDALLDARMACLDRRRQALVETVAILVNADPDVVDHAGGLLAKLPRLDACEDLGALLEREPPSEDELELESRLVRAETLANAGRVPTATELAREVAAEAEQRELPRLVVEALLTEARAALLFERERSSLAELLDRALRIALEKGFDELAAEAMIRRVYVRGLMSGGSGAALADVGIAEAMLVHAGDDPELRALLHNNVGAIHAAAGEREAAALAFARALAIKERLYGVDHLELALGLANLGMLSADPQRRRTLHARMIDIYELRLGPDHPRTLDARMLAAFYTGDPQAAGAAYAELCPRFRAIGELRVAGECELERGRVEVVRGRVELARPAFVAAREQLGADLRRVLLDAYLSLGTADPSAAIAALREQIDAVEPNQHEQGWWIRLEQAERRAVLGRLLTQIDEPTAAAVELERAVVELEAIADQAQPIEHQRLLASARLDLASAWSRSPGADRAAIIRLCEAAEGTFASWPDAYAVRLAELARLTAEFSGN